MPVIRPVILIICLFLASRESMGQSPCGLSNPLFPADTLLVCKDTLIDLSVPPLPGAVYRWSTGSTDTIERFTRAGTYWLEIQTPGCSLADTITLLFNSLVQAPETDSLVLCLNSAPGPLTAKGRNLLWYDTLATGGAPSGSAPVARTSVLGEQTYYVSQTIYGCESPRAPLTVEVIRAPRFSLGDHIIIPCGAFGVSLQVVEEKYTSYRWSDGTEGPLYDASRAGIYVLRGENICGSMVDTVVAVDCETRCLRFPNAFTPNGDGLNDQFTGIAHCPVDRYHLVVFNRFGEKVFESFNPADRWDGTWHGKPQPGGAYVYACQYHDFVLKQDQSVKGTIYLMR